MSHHICSLMQGQHRTCNATTCAICLRTCTGDAVSSDSSLGWASQPFNTFGSLKTATWHATRQTSGWSLKIPMTNLNNSEAGARDATHGQQTPSIGLSTNIVAPSSIDYMPRDSRYRRSDTRRSPPSEAETKAFSFQEHTREEGDHEVKDLMKRMPDFARTPASPGASTLRGPCAASITLLDP
jgi:hypothetical protein